MQSVRRSFSGFVGEDDEEEAEEKRYGLTQLHKLPPSNDRFNSAFEQMSTITTDEVGMWIRTGTSC